MNKFEDGLLRYLSSEQLKHIQSKKIGIGGAGGLGSNVAIMLVRSGFKHFEILDEDIIEASNLNRQQYFIDEIGQVKVSTIKARLLAINPDCDINIHHIKWAPQMGDQFFLGCHFIVEAFDQRKTKQLFADYYHDRTPVLVSGNGMAGLLEKKPMSVIKIGNIYMAGDRTTDSADHPPMAPRVMACAAMMAEVILELTLKEPAPDQDTAECG